MGERQFFPNFVTFRVFPLAIFLKKVGLKVAQTNEDAL